MFIQKQNSSRLENKTAKERPTWLKFFIKKKGWFQGNAASNYSPVNKDLTGSVMVFKTTNLVLSWLFKHPNPASVHLGALLAYREISQA